MLHYHINNNFSKVWNINNNLDQFIIDHLCEPIDNDKDWVIVVSLSVHWDWQINDKIH